MKLKEEIKNIKTDRKSLQSFAWIVGGIFLALGLLSGHKHGNWINFFSCLGATLIIFGLLAPTLLRQVYVGWMALGLIMGMIVAPVLFTLLFFLAVTPIAIIMRLSGKKFFNMEFRSMQSTYWIPKVRKQDYKKSIENQF